jgi:hypothetical protein
MNIIELLKKNKTAEPKAFDRIYGALVEKKLERKGYTPSKIQAILNNYLAEPENSKYKAEFFELQERRKECKTEAKTEMGIE